MHKGLKTFCSLAVIVGPWLFIVGLIAGVFWKEAWTVALAGLVLSYGPAPLAYWIVGKQIGDPIDRLEYWKHEYAQMIRGMLSWTLIAVGGLAFLVGLASEVRTVLTTALIAGGAVGAIGGALLLITGRKLAVDVAYHLVASRRNTRRV